MSERGSHNSTEEVVDLFHKIEVRLDKARSEAAGLRWCRRLNPARRKRLNHYDRALTEARNLWRDGDSASSLAALRLIDQRYSSVLGLVYGTPRKRENRVEVHEIEQERVLERKHTPSGGFYGGGVGGGGDGV